MNAIKQLIGHTNQDNAYVVYDYPYGFTLRTQIRYWIETKKNHGQRLVSQTLNPKTGKWNKPKAGTYTRAAVLGLDVETGYVTVRGVSDYADLAEWESFAKVYQLDEYQAGEVKRAIKAKRLYEEVKAELGEGASYSDILTEVHKRWLPGAIAEVKGEAQAA